ncbi:MULTISPECIES: TIGR03943 family protein [unclassified Streptomyces]|uniref:TIGR03943 family putative permease subunit n=1 Tax=unclassified Streptomyces TaxID=2593676 RepID=UPI002257B8E7|nr:MULTISPECIES: TIGR03943 family protein [unclassified Streptomyces]MCX4992823.1 TIGR03943 family protein [Streptomyces sp. NBC_00568]MCX5001941.1 TIGR03943 family protein [Streptomyces sp. NBC_00638]
MNRQAQAAVLFLVGAAVLHASVSDLYLRYVKAGLQPLLLAAGVVLVVTALATVWYEVREHRTASADRPDAARDGEEAHGYEDGSADDTQGHGHTHREPRISWLLVLPLLALILVAPPALGSYSAMRTGTALQAPFGYAKLPAGDPVPLGLVDYASRAAYDHGRSLGGRQVKISGFLALDHAGTPYLVRMALNCCAADAQPVKIGLTGRIPPVLRPDTWLEVTGTYTGKRTKDPVNGGIIPFLDVSAARPVATPRDPYDESWNN